MQHRKIVLLMLSLLLSLSGCLSNTQYAEDSVPYPALVNVTIERTTSVQHVSNVSTPAETTSLPPATSIPTTELSFPRPSTGTIEAGDLFTGGQGQLTIDNAQGGNDMVAVLTLNGTEQARAAIYIQNGDLFTFQAIPDDTYALYVTRGSNWDPQHRQFITDAQNLLVNDPLHYTTTNTESTSKVFFFHKEPNEYDPAATLLDQKEFPRL